MTARIKQTLAYLNGLGELPRCILERGKHEIAKRMIIGKREPIFEGTGERIVGIGRHSADALADITWRSDARPFAQNARRPAVIGHGDHRRGFQAHGKQRADGNGRTRSAADDHGFQAAGFRHHGIGRIQRRKGLGHGRIMGEMTTLHMGFLLHIAHPIGLQPASQTR